MTEPLRRFTFTDWLATASITSGPAGDLIDDMLTDDRLPGFRSLGHMRAHLKRRSACCGAMQAASAVWRRYRRWRDRQALELVAQSLSNT